MLDVPASAGPMLNIAGISPIFPGWIGFETTPAAPEIGANDWFDPEPLIGKRGHKYFPHAGRLGSAAVKLVADALGVSIEDLGDDETALVIGTNFGVHESLRDIESVVGEHGFSLLSPLSSPNFSVNIPSSLAGIKSHITGFNITLTDSFTAPASALALAAMTVRGGLIKRCLAGGMDDASSVSGCNETNFAKDAACIFLVDDGSAGRSVGKLRILQGRFARSSARNRNLYERLTALLNDRQSDHSIRVYGANPHVAHDVVDLLKAQYPNIANEVFESPGDTLFGGMSPLYGLARSVRTAKPVTVLSVGPTRGFVAIRYIPEEQRNA